MTADELRNRLIAAGETVTLSDSISEKTLAKLLGIAPRTMRDRRTRQGDVPRYRLNGRSCVYEVSDVCSYLESRKLKVSGSEWQRAATMP